MTKINDLLVDQLATGYAEYLATFVHDFVASRKDAPGDLLPDYAELMGRLGTISARAAVAYIINPLLAASTVDESALQQQLDVLYADIPDEVLVGMAEEEARLARAQYLANALPEWQQKHGQLYDDELPAMRELVDRALAAEDEQLLALLPELEEMWVLVQPGIRYHRGDADWAAALEQHIEEAVERLHDSDRENYLIQKCLLTMQGSAEIKAKAREILDAQLADIAATREETEGTLAALDAQERNIREKRRGLR